MTRTAAKHPEPAAADLPPHLTARILDLFADMLRSRAGSKVDDVSVLQRLVADLTAELAARTSANSLMTVAEAADAAGTSAQTVRNWCRGHGVGMFDRTRGMYLISRDRLRDFLFQRHGRLPANLR